MRKTLLLCAGSLCLGAPMAAATQAEPPAVESPASVMGWLIGEWRGSGTMFGGPSEAALGVRPVLGGRFIEFTYRAGQFEGRAFYRPVGEGRWRATWFDNRGISFPIEAVLTGQTLSADWGSAETERGRTVYRLLPDGRLEVTDTAGGRDFARHVLGRAD